MQNVLVILSHIRLSVNFYGIYFGMKSRFLLGFENITAKFNTSDVPDLNTVMQLVDNTVETTSARIG